MAPIEPMPVPTGCVNVTAGVVAPAWRVAAESAVLKTAWAAFAVGRPNAGGTTAVAPRVARLGKADENEFARCNASGVAPLYGRLRWRERMP